MYGYLMEKQRLQDFTSTIQRQGTFQKGGYNTASAFSVKPEP